jgi:hypothetical protein
MPGRYDEDVSLIGSQFRQQGFRLQLAAQIHEILFEMWSAGPRVVRVVEDDDEVASGAQIAEYGLVGFGADAGSGKIGQVEHHRHCRAWRDRHRRFQQRQRERLPGRRTCPGCSPRVAAEQTK